MYPLWELNVKAEVLPGQYEPVLRLTWQARDSINGQAGHSLMVTREMLDMGPMHIDYLLEMANEKFRKFFKERGLKFSEMVDAAYREYQRQEQERLSTLMYLTMEEPTDADAPGTPE